MVCIGAIPELQLTVTLKDPRAADVSPFTLRSINLAISARGLAALRSVDPSLGSSIGMA